MSKPKWKDSKNDKKRQRNHLYTDLDNPDRKQLTQSFVEPAYSSKTDFLDLETTNKAAARGANPFDKKLKNLQSRFNSDYATSDQLTELSKRHCFTKQTNHYYKAESPVCSEMKKHLLTSDVPLPLPSEVHKEVPQVKGERIVKFEVGGLDSNANSHPSSYKNKIPC